MINYRKPSEVKKSIFTGLDEAIIITKNISQDKASEKEPLSKYRKTKIGKQRNPAEKTKLKSLAGQNISLKVTGSNPLQTRNVKTKNPR